MEGESYFRRLARIGEEGKRAIIAVGTGTGTTGEVCGVTLSSFSLSFHPAGTRLPPSRRRISSRDGGGVFSAADAVYRYYYHYR